jgi:hypothetical protein
MAHIKWLLMMVTFVSVASAWSDTISGSWKGSMMMDSGSSQPACMTLKQDGANLTGTAGACDGKEFPITTGTVSGELVTVEAHPGAPALKFAMKLRYNKLKGDVFENDEKIGTISMEKAAQ